MPAYGDPNYVGHAPISSFGDDRLGRATTPAAAAERAADARQYPMYSLNELSEAGRLVHAVLPPTPQYAWPMLEARLGIQVIVKHENHTPTGAFKVRGGLVYMDRLKRERPTVGGVISATRGNHGQSLAFAGQRAGVRVTILVPHGNSIEKNAAMRAFGAEVIEHGADFDEARMRLPALAVEQRLEIVPPFHPDLVLGVATYAHELFTAGTALDTVYVPIGLGSGICGLIQTRDLLGLTTRIVGVVATAANAYARSFAAGQVVTTCSAHTFADGIAVRQPDPDALAIIRHGADRIVEVTDDAIADAIRILHEDTHNLAEGAGAAALAALIQERRRLAGRKVAVVLTGGNLDRPLAARILAGPSPPAP
jgi:threonine dehydratase